jgi:hypothetical protein
LLTTHFQGDIAMRCALAAVFVTVATAAFAQAPTPDIASCAAKADEKERLSCFDQLSKSPTASTEPEKSAKTAEIIKTFAPGEYRVVETEDIHVAPGKYEGKPIEIRRVRCFHADKAEYRCGGGGSLPVMVVAPVVTPDNARASLEDECGEVRKVYGSPRCLKTIRVVMAGYRSDRPTNRETRVIVLTNQIEIVDQAPTGNRKR